MAIQVRWGPRTKFPERVTTVVLLVVGLALAALAVSRLLVSALLDAAGFGVLGVSMLWAGVRGIQLTREIPVDDEGYPLR